ncbi:MAG: hypothetical protein DMG05_27290, partial [Acidobacteria bacterium]
MVLYELATGRLPFSGPTVNATLNRIIHAQPQAIARFNYDLPSELDHIILKCLKKDRERRYQSARELLIDLRNLKRDSNSDVAAAIEDLSAEIATSAWQLPRWGRWAVNLAGVGFILAVVLAFWLWSPSPKPTVSSYIQITTDGRPKVNRSFNDGLRLYFSELERGHFVLAQVSNIGGETVGIPSPFADVAVLDISPNRSELLVSSRHMTGVGGLTNLLWTLPVLGGSPRRVGDIMAQGAA